MDIKTKGLILLTGAGFTKNFGGFLGSQMWDQIINDPEIQDNDNLRVFCFRQIIVLSQHILL